MVGSGQSSSFVDCASGFPRQGFEVARRQIFFAELNVVDSGDCCFADFFQE